MKAEFETNEGESLAKFSDAKVAISKDVKDLEFNKVSAIDSVTAINDEQLVR